MRYKLVSRHPEDLASGTVLGPSELVELSAEEVRAPHNQRLVAEGKLIEAPKSSRKSRLQSDEQGGEG